MSLPPSLEIFATDISLDDTMRTHCGTQGWWVGKNASCSKLGDEKASCSELAGLQLPGVRWSYRCSVGG